MAVVAATGFFDGVHIGHRLVLETLSRTARERGEESLVVTFWPHPRNVLQDDARNLRLLSSLEEKKALILSAGVDRVEVLPFTRQFSRLSTREYLRDVLKGTLGCDTVVLGYDNRMGSDLLDPESVARVAAEEGLKVVRVASVDTGSGETVSSTRIRRCLSEGNVSLAADMLGYRYTLHGVVVAGDRLGRTIGFPTANMQLYEPLKLIPSNGVYSVDVETLGGYFRGMTNIGVRPTVSGGGERRVETHIFGFDEDIYGLDIKISFRQKIRDEKRFPSLEQLRLQLESDRESALKD